MIRLSLLFGLCALAGCVRESPDSRLDDDRGLDPRARAALLKLDCSQRREEVLAARDDSQSDAERVANYRLALKAFTAAAERLDAAFSKEPDLLYAAEGDALRLRLQRCQAQARTFTEELRKFELSLQFKPAPAQKVEQPAPVKVKKTRRSTTRLANRKHPVHHAVLADAR